MNKITTIGLDTAKSVFHVVGLNRSHRVVLKKRLRRHQVLAYFARLPAGRVALEACSGSHYWARQLEALGHSVRQIPAQDVKALARKQKNDYHDARAIAEAVHRPEQRFVATKSPGEQDLQALHRLRRGLLRERTALSNRIRGLLAEYGLVMSKGLSCLRRRLPELLEDADNGLSRLMRELLADAQDQLRWLDAAIARSEVRLNEQLKNDDKAQRLLTIPGFGRIVASVWCAKMGHAHQFRRGREAAAALGLVPRQRSTGGKPLLLGITKSGDPELRSLLIHGARAVLIHAHKKNDALSRWACQLKARCGMNKATVALANKMARIAWAVSVNNTVYQPKLAA